MDDDLVIRNEAVAEYIEYTKERASWWIRKYPNLHDDIMATALLALVQGFNHRIPEQPKGYISACVDNAVKDMLGNNYLIHIPKSEIKRLKDEKKDLSELPRAIHLDDEELWNLQRSQEPPPWVPIFIKEIYALLGLTDREQRIIDLRMLGYTNEEIGLEFSISETAIRKTLKHLKGRYLNLIRQYTELLKPNDES